MCKTTGGAAEAIPRECFSILETPAGQKLPTTQHVKAFTIKHARQQAAILGQMQQAGLLQARPALVPSTVVLFLECGHGRRQQMIAIFDDLTTNPVSIHPSASDPDNPSVLKICSEILLEYRDKWREADRATAKEGPGDIFLPKYIVDFRNPGAPRLWNLAPARGICRACWRRALALPSL